MDFGKYKYLQARQQKDARKKQTVIQVKEVKLGPKTDVHDFDFKAKHVRRFLEEGNKAKVTIRFRGREMVHTELGRRLLDRMTQTCWTSPRSRATRGWRAEHGHDPDPEAALGSAAGRDGDTMPKIKTKRSAAKRIRATGTGSWRAPRAGRSTSSSGSPRSEAPASQGR
jgi:hypothetical protein